jgi:hypothetical protein
MATCQSCGGVIGRDCFNPEECAWITQQQANQCEAARYSAEEAHHNLQQLKAEIAAYADALEREVDSGLYTKHKFIIGRLRQLSAV